jgi:maltodextrin utilization protein YvdJ
MDASSAAIMFFDIIDNSFNEYAVFYSVIANTFIQYIMNTILILVLAAVMLLIKVKYKKVTTYKQNLSIIIASMTMPSILSFIISLFRIAELNAFSVVLFQFITPFIAILAIYKGENNSSKSIKHL